MTKKHWLEEFVTNEGVLAEGYSRFMDITYNDCEIELKLELHEDLCYAWTAHHSAQGCPTYQVEFEPHVDDKLSRYDTLCLIEQMLPISRPVDPACDLDEGLTVLDVLGGYKIPNDINNLIVERQQFGLEKYGKPLRVGWDKAAQYSREEIGDLLAYEILNGRKWYVTFLAWFFYLFGSKVR